MIICRIMIIKIFLKSRYLFVTLFFWLTMSYVFYVFAQTNNDIADSDKSISRINNADNSKKPILIKPLNLENKNSDQENIGREAMLMIMEITKSNILYEKNKVHFNRERYI